MAAEDILQALTATAPQHPNRRQPLHPTPGFLFHMGELFPLTGGPTVITQIASICLLQPPPIFPLFSLGFSVSSHLPMETRQALIIACVAPHHTCICLFNACLVQVWTLPEPISPLSLRSLALKTWNIQKSFVKLNQ